MGEIDKIEIVLLGKEVEKGKESKSIIILSCLKGMIIKWNEYNVYRYKDFFKNRSSVERWHHSVVLWFFWYFKNNVFKLQKS